MSSSTKRFWRKPSFWILLIAVPSLIGVPVATTLLLQEHSYKSYLAQKPLPDLKLHINDGDNKSSKQ